MAKKYNFDSIDPEKRKLNSQISTLKFHLKNGREKRKRLKDENDNLQKENKKLKEKLNQKEEEMQELKRQRDMFRGMLFKTNKKSEIKEDEALKPALTKQKIKRKRGGQIGHVGYGRKKPEIIDETRRAYLKVCPHCNTEVNRSKKVNSHIVQDIETLENIKPKVNLYEIEEQWCPCCNKHVRAKVAQVIPGSKLGINLVVLVLILKYGSRNTWESIAFILANFFNIKVSAGGLVNIAHRAKKILGPTYDEILNEIRIGKIKFADETSWRVDGINHCLWGFFNEKNAYYVIEKSHGKGVPQRIFKDCYDSDHVLVRDDAPVYQKLEFNHQSCWSHLLRVTHDATMLPKATLEIKQLHKYLKRIYDDLAYIIELPFNKVERLGYFKKYEKIISGIIATKFKEKDTLKIQTRITNQKNNLITALIYENVPLTNNHSERCIRPFVIARKVSGGSRSDKGAKTHAVNMSIFQTIKMKKLPPVGTLKNYLLSS